MFWKTFLIKLQAVDAATGGSLQEKLFLEISQNSKENTVPERLF